MIYAAYSGDIKIFERGLALQSVLGNVFPLPFTVLVVDISG